MNHALSPQEIATFKERGWLGPFRLLSREAAHEIGRRLETEVLTVPNRIYVNKTGQEQRAHMQFTRDRQLDSPLVYRIGSRPEIVDRLTSLLGSDVLLWRSDFFVQAEGDQTSALHQDKKFSGSLSIPGIETSDGGTPFNVTAWLAFTDTKLGSGGLLVAPGTNKSEIPEVAGDGLFGKRTRIGREFTAEELVPLNVEAGEFILFDNMIVHGSSPTQKGETTRVAISIRYVDTSVRVNPRGTQQNGHGQDLSRFGSLVVAGQDRFGHNVLRDPPRGRPNAPLAQEVAIADLSP